MRVVPNVLSSLLLTADLGHYDATWTLSAPVDSIELELWANDGEGIALAESATLGGDAEEWASTVDPAGYDAAYFRLRPFLAGGAGAWVQSEVV